jgi:nucleotide-binding universal stress UspA family protein
MYQTILLPLDGSGFSEAAVPAALGLSQKTGASLRLVTVIEFFPTSAPYGWEDAARDQAAEYLDDLKERIQPRAGGEVTATVLMGHVPSALEAEAESTDLVVMASHGRGGLSRAWLGSVADHVARHAEHPVLLVRPEEGVEPDLEVGWTVKKMLLPLDGSEISEAILGHATQLGSRFGAAYHLLRVVPSPKQFASSYPPDLIEANRERILRETEEAKEYLKSQGERLRTAGVTVEERVLTGGQPAHDILAEAQAADCDFIAISAHGRGRLARALLGSTSDKVVRGTHLPILLYRAKKQD